VSNDPGWLIVTGGASGTGFGRVSYSVAANAGVPRIGTVAIGGQTFTVYLASTSATTPFPPEGLFAASVAGNLVTLRWALPSVGPAPAQFVLEGGVAPGQVLASI
jgi:hypothetical protein